MSIVKEIKLTKAIYPAKHPLFYIKKSAYDRVRKLDKLLKLISLNKFCEIILMKFLNIYSFKARKGWVTGKLSGKVLGNVSGNVIIIEEFSTCKHMTSAIGVWKQSHVNELKIEITGADYTLLINEQEFRVNDNINFGFYLMKQTTSEGNQYIPEQDIPLINKKNTNQKINHISGYKTIKIDKDDVEKKISKKSNEPVELKNIVPKKVHYNDKILDNHNAVGLVFGKFYGDDVLYVKETIPLQSNSKSLNYDWLEIIKNNVKKYSDKNLIGWYFVTDSTNEKSVMEKSIEYHSKNSHYRYFIAVIKFLDSNSVKIFRYESETNKIIEYSTNKLIEGQL